MRISKLLPFLLVPFIVISSTHCDLLFPGDEDDETTELGLLLAVLTGADTSGVHTVSASEWDLSYDLTVLKCPLGQTFDGSSCTGSRSALQFCTTDNNNCNGGTNSGNLTVPTGGSSSQIYSQCQALNDVAYAGRITWRVPTCEITGGGVTNASSSDGSCEALEVLEYAFNNSASLPGLIHDPTSFTNLYWTGTGQDLGPAGGYIVFVNNSMTNRYNVTADNKSSSNAGAPNNAFCVAQ